MKPKATSDPTTRAPSANATAPRQRLSIKPERALPKRLPLRWNFAWAFVANVIYGASQWGIIVLLAKLTTAADVGAFALSLAVCTPLFTFTNLHLRETQATDALKEYSFADYLGLRLITSLVALVMLGAIVSFTEYSLPIVLAILGLGISKYFESMSDLTYGLFQQQERMDRVGVSLVLRGCLGLLGFAVGLYVTGNATGGIAGLALSSGCVVLAYDMRHGLRMLRERSTPQRDCEDSRLAISRAFLTADPINVAKLAKLTVPLGIVMVLISLQASIPRYLIESYLGQSALGVFAAMAYFMLAGTTVAAALGQAANPRMAQFFASGNHGAFTALLFKQVGIGAALAIVGVLIAASVGRPLLTLTYGPEYAEHIRVFIVLMVAAGISYVVTFLGHAVMATRKFGLLLPLHASVTLCTGVVCWWQVQANGLLGGALGMLVGASVQLLGTTWLLTTTLRRASPGALLQVRKADI